MALLNIQKLQFSDKASAEKLMLAFLKENEDSAIVRVELTPKPESLNSINGFITYDNGERVFFKTHVEENEQISEYYNAEMLAKAGYPVVSARQITHRPGKQIALYEIVSSPTLFALLKAEEDKLIAGEGTGPISDKLVKAQEKLDCRVFEIYKNTLSQITADEHSRAPIHQLFSHRLAEEGRFGLFYKNKTVRSDNQLINFEQLANLHWRVNGVLYHDTIADIVERSRRLLKAIASPSIIGHGDAHNGNIFVDPDHSELKMFDPAFAGKHDPLLDIIKPLFHNIFARWMYFPEQVSREIHLEFQIHQSEIKVNHNFFPSSLRLQFLKSRLQNVLLPTLDLLKSKGCLHDEWTAYMRSALFCCPFLTVNLLAEYKQEGTLSERYPLLIKILGLALAVSFGSLSHESESELSRLIDGIFDQYK